MTAAGLKRGVRSAGTKTYGFPGASGASMSEQRVATGQDANDRVGATAASDASKIEARHRREIFMS